MARSASHEGRTENSRRRSTCGVRASRKRSSLSLSLLPRNEHNDTASTSSLSPSTEALRAGRARLCRRRRPSASATSCFAASWQQCSLICSYPLCAFAPLRENLSLPQPSSPRLRGCVGSRGCCTSRRSRGRAGSRTTCPCRPGTSTRRGTRGPRPGASGPRSGSAPG